MNWKFILVIIAIVAAGREGLQYYREHRQAKIMQQVQNTPAAKYELGVPDNCRGKKYCVTAYVAPWCPACKATIGTFQALNVYLPKHRPDVGFGMIVGAAPAAENDLEKSELAPIEVYADNTGVIFKNRGIRGYPTWIINDASGKEVLRQSGGLQINGDEQMAQFISQFLKI